MTTSIESYIKTILNYEMPSRKYVELPEILRVAQIEGGSPSSGLMGALEYPPAECLLPIKGAEEM